MARIKPLFRVLAMVNALLLLGGYVCYRGGIVRAFSAKTPERAVQGDPPPVVQTPTPPKDGEPAPVVRPIAVPNIATPRRKEIDNDSMFSIVTTPTTQQRQELLGGSKSIVMNIEPPQEAQPADSADATPANEAGPARREQSGAVPDNPATRRRVIMGSSKSDKVGLEEVEEPAKPAQSAAAPTQPGPEERAAIEREILLGGSKSERITIEPVKPAAQPPRQEAPRQQSSQSAPVKLKKLMGGSKSAPIEIDLGEKK